MERLLFLLGTIIGVGYAVHQAWIYPVQMIACSLTLGVGIGVLAAVIGIMNS